MGPRATIGHATVCKDLEYLCLGEYASIGRLNWITGYPKTGAQYQQEDNRRAELILERHAAVTGRHLLDCTNSIHIGQFATVGGVRSTILTHSIDLKASRQASRPVTIGDYCFVSTCCVVLGGSTLPNHSVLAAHSLLNKQLVDSYVLYGGTPARPIDQLPHDLGYFTRQKGCVV